MRTLFLTLFALAFGASAASTTAPPAGEAARLDSLVADARRTKDAIGPVIFELADMTDACARHPGDARLAEGYRAERARLEGLMATAGRQVLELAEESRRYADRTWPGQPAPPGPEATRSPRALLARGEAVPVSPDLAEFERAQEFASEADGFLRTARQALATQDQRWRDLEAARRDRRFYTLLFGVLAGTLLAVTAAVAWGARSPRAPAPATGRPRSDRS